MEKTRIFHIKSGKIQGYLEDGIEIYKGIPYAEAPIGDLRFREPLPKKQWEEIRDCTQFGAIAPQQYHDDPRIELPEDEDCLYLNIWTPGSDDKRRPVMVWIHGGGYLIGGGGRPRSDGIKLASYGDLVVVSFNYRLGALGFLNLPGIPPNLGIQDQVAALKWIKENIEVFGGDSNNVTIFGESAGGQSVTILLAIVSSKGLFHRAIVQSGAANPRDFKPERSIEGAEKFIGKLGIRKENIDMLRKVPLEKLLFVQRKIVGNLFNIKSSPFWPYIDGEFISEQPIETIRKGNNHQVPMIIGYNENELGFLSKILINSGGMKKKIILKFVRSAIQKGDINKQDLENLITFYREDLEKKYPDNPFMYWDFILSDSMFKIPIIRQLEAHAIHQSNIYCYIFSYKSPKFGFALHTFEIPFVFNTIDQMDVAEGAGEISEESKKLTKIMMDTWIAFARSGNPDNEGIPKWSEYNLEKRYIMKLSTNPKIIETNEDSLRKVWNGIL
ncbi:MAG: carboxylesterase family protein [Candidatus Lokiarchaeota archaeon]|nr:carboxylesterase family protein [Candidatus Lokiarchaeota archaeon]